MELVRQKNVATVITFPIIDADGDVQSGATGLDSESTTWADGSTPGAFADLTNEATEIGTTGIYYLSLTAAEMNFDYVYIQIKTTSSGAKTQHILIRTMVGAPTNLATNQAGRTLDVSAGGEAGLDWANVGSPTTTQNLSGTSTKAVEPTVAGRTLDVSAGGEAGLDWANIGSPTTAQNLSGTSTKAVEPTVAGRTLDVSAGGEAGLDWANIGSPTTAQNLSGTSTKAVEPTVAGRTLDVSAGGEAGVDWANVGTPGSTVSLSATTVATVTTATNLTNAATAGDLTAAMKTSVNTEVLDVLNVDTFAEPTGAPAATTTLAGKIGRIYQALRNKLTVTTAQKSFFDDAGGSLWVKTTSDDGTTYTENEGA